MFCESNPTLGRAASTKCPTRSRGITTQTSSPSQIPHGAKAHSAFAAHRKSSTHLRFAQNDTRDYVLNPSDKEYYIRRAKLYTDITAKLADLDPVRDYSEINGIGHKRQCIRQDFRQLMEKTNKFSKQLLNS